MVHVTSCWSPIIWSDNLKTGCRAIAGYTWAASIFLMTFIIFDMSGGDSTQLYNPLFEADVRLSMQVIGGLLIVYFLLLMVSAGIMLHGLNIVTRGLLLPWMVLFGLAVAFQIVFGLWLLGGYYIYLECVFYTFVIWLWGAYNAYLWLVVYSQYHEIEKLQSPNIELLWP